MLLDKETKPLPDSLLLSSICKIWWDCIYFEFGTISIWNIFKEGKYWINQMLKLFDSYSFYEMLPTQ